MSSTKSSRVHEWRWLVSLACAATVFALLTSFVNDRVFPKNLLAAAVFWFVGVLFGLNSVVKKEKRRLLGVLSIILLISTFLLPTVAPYLPDR